ncbi:MAG: TROVE domain-containing protein [bacterium]|nr:TROVE domain-containing protein [bacterium]
MSKLNVPGKQAVHATFEGAKAVALSPIQELRRTVMACLLWESGFYESGKDIADRIASLVPLVKETGDLEKTVIEARNDMHLRHVPLFLIREMARHDNHKGAVACLLEKTIQRPDELAEFMAIYWKNGRCPISAQVKKGLAAAFRKFDEYQLAKYNRKAPIRLRDILFLVHPKPENKGQEDMWRRLAESRLNPPDTWERALSSGCGKKETWTRMLSEKKLGSLALLRNLRNMMDAEVDFELINSAILAMSVDKILPFRFIAAKQSAEEFAPALEKSMLKSLEGTAKLKGRTILLVDASGSMYSYVSFRAAMSRFDASHGLAVLLREVCENVSIYTFSEYIKKVKDARGFALVSNISASQPAGGTKLGKAVEFINKNEDYDRIIVLTDEQTEDAVPDPKKSLAYMINIASSANGVGYGAWTHIDGWSESVVKYISEMAKEF